MPTKDNVYWLMKKNDKIEQSIDILNYLKIAQLIHTLISFKFKITLL